MYFNEKLRGSLNHIKPFLQQTIQIKCKKTKTFLNYGMNSVAQYMHLKRQNIIIFILNSFKNISQPTKSCRPRGLSKEPHSEL